MPLSAQGVEGVKQALDSTVKDGFPGLVFSAVDKAGNVLVEHASGTLGVESQDPMSSDSTLFWIASCTKLVTAVAVLQLVEQGKIPLDDGEFVKKVCPEIKDKKVYADGVNGVDRENEITVNMLLAHTAGFGYGFFDPRIRLNGVSIEGEKGDVNDILNGPIVNQPGSTWEYGTNIDWAGIILERVTGQKLGDYFAEHIFAPLGIPVEGATMFPDQNAQKNLAKMQQRDASGVLKAREHLYSAPLKASKDEQGNIFQSGGAGLFAKPREYVKLLAAIINDGTDPKSGKQILKKESVDQLWVNRIPNQPDFARAGVAPANPELVNAGTEFYPQPGNPPQGWGFGGFLTIEPGPTGRGKNTLWWMGLANCFWWMDRERGVAGMLGAQVLPNGDPKVIPAWFMAEKAIYDGLQ